MLEFLYFPLERLILFMHNGVAAFVQGFFLGILSNRQLENLTYQRYLKDFPTDSSCAAAGHLNSGLFGWEQAAIDHYFPKGGRVLVAAAGAGREMFALTEAGFRVDGFDCCPPLVEFGREELTKRGLDSKLYHASPSQVPAVTGRYDAVLVGFSGYMYIAGRERRIRFLKDLSGILDPEAPLMVSFTEGFPGRRRVWTARVGTAIRSLLRETPVEEGDCLKGGFQHHFMREQIASEMSEAGFEPVFYSGGTTYGHAVGLVTRSG